MMSDPSVLTEATSSLERIQDFDTKTLARDEDLGRQLSFADIVEPANRIVSLYRRVPIEVLQDLSPQLLKKIKDQADADFSRFRNILEFSASESNAAQTREALMAQVRDAYDAAFNALWQFIAFGVARMTDTAVLENQARAVLQGIDDSSKEFQKKLADNEQEAERILQNIKAVAAEQGVSQQAEFFKQQADQHADNAREWKGNTLIASGVMLILVVLSMFLHRWEWFSPKNNFELAQFITSKILLFALIGYWVVLSARNFLSHEHNSVVNRHRQTALQTYRALADAAGADGTEDVVLAHASACVFSPQDTGFTKAGAAESAGPKSVLELLTKSGSGSAS